MSRNKRIELAYADVQHRRGGVPIVPVCAIIVPFVIFKKAVALTYIIKIKIHSICEIEDFVETHICKPCVIYMLPDVTQRKGTPLSDHSLHARASFREHRYHERQTWTRHLQDHNIFDDTRATIEALTAHDCFFQYYASIWEL